MLSKIISLDSYLNIVSSYIIFVTCINIWLVKFEVIYQQAFHHNTHGLFHHKQLGWINCMPRIAHATLIWFVLDVSDIARLCSRPSASSALRQVPQRALLASDGTLGLWKTFPCVFNLCVQLLG